MREINAMIAKLKMGSPEVAARVAARVAPAFSQLAKQSFDAHQSPSGDPWPSGIDLVESGSLREHATKYESHGTKVRANVARPRYARYQLKYGFLPRSGALPASWDATVTRIADQELQRSLGAP